MSDDEGVNWDDLENPLGLDPDTLDRLYTIFGTDYPQGLILSLDKVDINNVRGFTAPTAADVIAFLAEIGVLGYDDVFVVSLDDGFFTAAIPWRTT